MMLINVKYIIIGTILITMSVTGIIIAIFHQSGLLNCFNSNDKMVIGKNKVKNKFMEMSVFDFEKYMSSVIVSILLENVELYISSTDKNGSAELQLRGYTYFLQYFDDIAEYIKLYYGVNYLKNFYDITFNKLLIGGEIERIIKSKGIR